MPKRLRIAFYPGPSDDAHAIDSSIQELMAETGIRGSVAIHSCLPNLLPGLGIAVLPALLIDDKVMLQGRLPSRDDLLLWFDALIPQEDRGPRQEVNLEWPASVEEAARRIVDGMTSAEAKSFSALDERELRSSAFFMGQGIRNGFGLWAGNKALLRSCGTDNADDASWVIIQAVQRLARDESPASETLGSDPAGGEENTKRILEVEELAAAVVKNALDLTAAFLRQWDDGENDARLRGPVALEFAYLILHLTNRVAHSSLNDLEHKRLTNAVGPTVVEALISILFSPPSSSDRDSLRGEIFQGINEAEIGYAKCQGLLEEPYFTGNSILSLFGRNVSRAVATSNPAALVAAVSTATDALKEIDLDGLVAAAAAALQPGWSGYTSPNELPAGWQESLAYCNFLLARDEYARIFRLAREEAAADGQQALFREDFVRGWETFAENPRFRTAIEWIEAADDAGPVVYRFFMECKPGGRFFPR